MTTFKAVLYGEKLPVSGTEVSASFTGDSLSIQIPNLPEIIVEVSSLKAIAGGFDHDALFLNWANTITNANEELVQHQFSLKSASKQDAKIIFETAPAHLMQDIKAWRNRNHRIKLVWGSIATVCATVILSAILIWWQYDRVMDYVVARIPVSTEQQYAKTGLAQLEASGKLIKTGPAVEAIKSIGGQLTKGSRYHYQWLVMNTEEVNAFAMPGGVVVVNIGLLKKADNADELAAVLAHEIQHVEKRHALKSMVTSAGWAAILAIVVGDVNAVSAVILHQAGALYYGRDLEAEADKLGLAALLKAKIKPDGFISFFTKLQKAHANEEPPSWISSHPATAERIKTLQALIKKSPCPDCKSVTIDWKATLASLSPPSKTPPTPPQ